MAGVGAPPNRPDVRACRHADPAARPGSGHQVSGRDDLLGATRQGTAKNSAALPGQPIMSTAVRFQRRGDIYEVSCPYDPRMVAVIKALPSSVRSWDPAAKVWKVDVDGGYARALAANLRELGYIVVGLAEPPPRRTTPVQWPLNKLR